MSDAEILGPNDPGPRDARDANYSTANGGGSGPKNGGTADAKPFPWERLAFTVLFAFIAWFVFWLSLILAVGAGVLKLFGVQTEENIAAYAGKTSGYLADLFGYISGARDEKPFPFG